MKNANLLVEHQCPQCGAPAVLEETERFFVCPYCRVHSYLMHNGHFRYYLPAKTPERQDLFYMPYWRFKGMWFSFQLSETGYRFIDTSQQAVSMRGFPATLGLRPQAMKMRFALPNTPGHFIRPSLPKTDALDLAEKRMNRTLKNASLHQAFIGETISVIYAPFYGEDRAFDGILEQPIGSPLDPAASPLKAPGGAPDKHIHFVPSLCPVCGWDMVGRKDTLVLHCRNCTSAWIAGRKEFKQVPFVFWAAKQPSPPTYYLPFWRIEAGISDMQLESYADLVRRANLPRAVQEKWEKRPLRFWTPAFKIKPQKFLRLATSLTVTQPQWKSISRIASFLAHPITLPLKEAIESLTIILADIVKPRKAIASKLPQIRITPASGLLVYLPFEESRHEFICPELQITVNKNLLTHAENL